MAEKRFRCDPKTDRIYDNESNYQATKNPLHWVRRLNDFDEECKKLKKENEQLKKENERLLLDEKNKKIKQLAQEKEYWEKSFRELWNILDFG